MARRRVLRPDERALWKQVADRTVPLRPESKPVPPVAPRAEPTPRKPEPEPDRLDLSGFSIGARAAPGPKPAAPERERPAPPRMDANTFRRMSRGKMGVEGRIDLHGLTLAEAHPRLIAFLHSAHSSGKRLVLVITGKGHDRADGAARGVLRRQVPHWIATGPANRLVLEIRPAHQRHGGSGALYVYLRRK